MSEYVLMHYGVKGMKWGVRKRYLDKNGSLNKRGIKKYAKKSYAKSLYDSNKSVAGKVYDKLTGAHKIGADIKYGSSSKQQNKAAAEKYLASKAKEKSLPTKTKIAKATAKGAATTAKVMTKVGSAYLTDQMFFGGAGTKLAKAAVKNLGRMTITGVEMARGGYDIHWYD